MLNVELNDYGVQALAFQGIREMLNVELKQMLNFEF